jgi:hypothetical protein
MPKKLANYICIALIVILLSIATKSFLQDFAQNKEEKVSSAYINKQIAKCKWLEDSVTNSENTQVFHGRIQIKRKIMSNDN